MSRAERALWVTGFYYAHLNEDKAFTADLAALFTKLEELGAPDPLTSEGRRTWEVAQHGSPDLTSELPEAYKDTPLGRRYRLASSIRQEVEAFLSRWPLPGRIWEDLRWSYHQHLRWGKSKGEQPRLVLGPFGEWLPKPGLPVVVDVHEVEGTTVLVVERQPWIFPSCPTPFLYNATLDRLRQVWLEKTFKTLPVLDYDPVGQDRKWLEKIIEAICREVRKSILEQARLYEEDVGAYWWKPGPRYRKRHEEWLAYILYLRVLHRTTWGELMKLATKTGFYSEGDDIDLLRKRVTALARLIGLPLPGIA
jgi:hypothetical protein